MRGRSFHDDFPTTSFLLLFVAAFFALELIGHYKLNEQLPGIGIGGIDFRVTEQLGSDSLYHVKEGQLWRLVASAFLHAGYIHILFNGFWLYDLGRFCEPLLSPWKFLFVYVASAIGGSIGSLLYSLTTPRSGSVGASGALCGLIGLMLVYSIRQRHPELRDNLLRWIAYLVVFSLIIENVDHAGHMGGFVVGCFLGLTVKDYMPSQVAARWRYPGYAAGAVLLLSLGAAIWSHFAAE